LTTTKLKMSQPVSISKNKPKIPLGSATILILLGILFPLLALEAIAYFFPSLIPLELKSVFQNEQDQPLKGLTPDEDLGYKYAPGLVNFSVPFEDDEVPNTYPVSTVSLGYTDAGFRDDGLQTEPFAVVIGDSYAGCASVEMEACWVELLEKKAGRDLANLSVVGYSPQQEARMLSKYGLPLQPKLVLWIFFANDLNDAWRFDQLGTGATKEGKFWQNPINAWLARNSVVYNIGSFFWYNRYLFYNLAQADQATVPRDSNLVWWLTYTDLNIPEVADGFALTQQAILEARRQTLAQSSQAKFVVIVLPYREQTYAPTTLQPQLDRLNQALADFCRQHQLACLDLTPTLREKAQDEADSIYFRKDIHLNARGNELVAELLAEALKVYW
jgi:lysophospholipase L1-like esterase